MDAIPSTPSPAVLLRSNGYVGHLLVGLNNETGDAGIELPASEALCETICKLEGVPVTTVETVGDLQLSLATISRLFEMWVGSAPTYLSEDAVWFLSTRW